MEKALAEIVSLLHNEQINKNDIRTHIFCRSCCFGLCDKAFCVIEMIFFVFMFRAIVDASKWMERIVKTKSVWEIENENNERTNRNDREILNHSSCRGFNFFLCILLHIFSRQCSCYVQIICFNINRIVTVLCFLWFCISRSFLLIISIWCDTLLCGRWRFFGFHFHQRK